MPLAFARPALLLACAALGPDEPPKAPAVKPADAVAARAEGMRKIEGFLPLYWDEPHGKLYLEIARFDADFLYQEALATGVGSNPLGLDRGQLGEPRVVRFRKLGPKVLLIEPNPKFRASTDRAAERRAGADSFAGSVHWGFKVEAEEKGRALVDATDFLIRDSHGVSESLRKAKQGTYKLDGARSAVLPESARGFPRNTEVEALLTFANEGEAGPLVAGTVPAPQALSVRTHHSFVELPPLGTGFVPRRPDPRVGVFAVDFYDFAAPLTEPVEKSWACRHRLVKKDPGAAVSEPVEPIVYYVDPGAPEPVRSALVEGASWWSEAFERAGFKNAFHVQVLPDDADPMDLRYNTIQWVHRSTRGWSYGNTVTDPRTGEILKGRVTLDSLRARQDLLIGQGLVTPQGGRATCAVAASPGAEHLADLDPKTEPLALVLARIRQLSAHEVGHTLGFAHNFAASTYDNRASVMDYPAPLVHVKGDALDLSDAYARGIGTYDVFAVQYAYSQFPPGTDEPNALGALVKQGLAEGVRFLSDADARPAGAAHPLANLWDNGPDPVAGLAHEMEVRRIGLEHFGLGKLGEGEPLSALEAKLLPLYLHHRYQLLAALKVVGGAEYSYAVREGDGASPAAVVAVVPADRQRKALEEILRTIEPARLVLPDRILALIPPPAFGTGFGTPERFAGKTGPTFDPIAAAVTAADLTVSGLLNPERAARLLDFESRDPKGLRFGAVCRALLTRAFKAVKKNDGRANAVAEAVRILVVTRLIELAVNESVAPGVRAEATLALSRVPRMLPFAPEMSPVDDAISRQVLRFWRRHDEPLKPQTLPPPPPGDPIGDPR